MGVIRTVIKVNECCSCSRTTKSKIGMIACNCKINYPITSSRYCFFKRKICSIKLVDGHNSTITSVEHQLMVICNCSSASSSGLSGKVLKILKQLWIIIIFINIGCTFGMLNDQQPLSISSHVHFFQMKGCIGYSLVVLKVSSIVFVNIKCLIISDKSYDIMVIWNITTKWRLIVVGSGKRLSLRENLRIWTKEDDGKENYLVHTCRLFCIHFYTIHILLKLFIYT